MASHYCAFQVTQLITFLKPLNTFWQQPKNNWIHSNPGRKATRLQFGKLLIAAWNQAAIVGNGTAGFSACGIYPCDPQEIPNHAFAISDGAVDESNSTAAVEEAVNIKEQEIFQHSIHRPGVSCVYKYHFCC